MLHLVNKQGIPDVCPNDKCKANPLEVKVINYDMMWHDGDIVCVKCGQYIRMFDAG